MADTNVLVSAAIRPHGVPARLLTAAAVGDWRLVVSPLLMSELHDVLGRQRLRRWITRKDAGSFIELVAEFAELVPDGPPLRESVTRDPGDDYLFALARAAGVDLIISGDGDLTDLAHAVPPVWTPAQFLTLLNTAHGRGESGVSSGS